MEKFNKVSQLSNLVAVYGSLRSGLHNHPTFGNCSANLQGKVELEGWDMYSMGSFPFITPGEGTITAEVYRVEPDTFMRLDRLEGYPSFYDRTLVDTKYGKVWVYFIEGRDKSGYTPVTKGDWYEWYISRNQS